MRIDILTLFPKMFSGPFEESIIKRAQEKGLVEITIHDLRKWGLDARKTVDDRPYGGGVGMILRVDIIDAALRALKLKVKSLPAQAGQKFQPKAGRPLDEKVILLDATGKKFTQKMAAQLSDVEHLVLIAGHYEGVDYRVHEHLVDGVISIGDYVLTGGELPAMVLTDAIVRLLPGVLVKPTATASESFSPPTTYNLPLTTLLEFPQYTRPEKFKDWKVPDVLLSGNHAEIEKWREEKSLEVTKKKRPDLLEEK